MKRDGATRSLWQDTVQDYSPVNGWERETVYDVLIVGAGITGLTTAVKLQQAGKKCIIAEAHSLGFGTTGGTTAHLNTLLDSTYDQVEKDFGEDEARLLHDAARGAINQIADYVERFGIDCGFSYQPGYLLAQNDKETDELQKLVEASVRAGVAVNYADSVPVPLPFVKAARFEDQAQFHATRYLDGLARAYEDAGGVLLYNAAVSKVAKEDEVFTVECSLGTIKSKNLVYATHLPQGINILDFRCAPYRSYAMAVTLSDGNYPQGLAYDMKDPYHYFRTHEVDGKTYAIVGGYDHKTGHEDNTDRCFAELEAYIRGVYDVASVDYRWSSQYYTSADGLPYIGHLPGADAGVYCGTGYEGNGMIHGTVAGQLISDLILGLPNPYTDLFKPSRIKPIAGFTEFVKENFDVVSQFIGKRFSYEKISTLSELAPGQATLADWEGKKVALYKDEKGKVFAVDPVCPHAKCIVGWNSAERSWDCPCHGARYTPQGEMITGPARHGLTPLLWEQMDGD
jgi:glycine/D-amino acid oxidase-like deaminating enzyme/nitrite reductase/ring-hydroxylating ferredoxin subunit